MVSRWDRRATKLAEAAGEGTVLAGCRADPPSADSLEDGLRAVAGSLGARLGRSIDGVIGREGGTDETVEQTAVDRVPEQGHAVLVVGGRLVLFDTGGPEGPDAVVGRWPVTDIALVSAVDVTTMTLNVTRVGIVFTDGTSLTFDAPRQGYARDIERFIDLLREAAGVVAPGD